jgi:hypothetical protein
MDLLMIRGYESNVEPHEFRPGGSSGKHKRRWIGVGLERVNKSPNTLPEGAFIALLHFF